MISEYTSYDPPRRVGMRMVDGPWFFQRFGGGWSFVDRGDGTAEATWRYTFTVRPRWLAPLADRIGIAVLGRDIARRIEGYARGCADPVVVAEAERLIEA